MFDLLPPLYTPSIYMSIIYKIANKTPMNQMHPDKARANLGLVTALLQHNVPEAPPPQPQPQPQPQPTEESPKEEKKEDAKTELLEVNKKIDTLTNLASSLIKEEKEEQ